MLKLTHCCLALALTALPSVTWSQEPESPEKPAKKGIRFICTEIAPDTSETLKLLGKKGIQDVELSSRMPGDLFEIPAEGTILLGQESGDPEKPITPLAIGKLPEGTKRATALLIPAKDRPDGTKYEIFLINDDALKGGSAYFLNLTPNMCMAKLDGEVLKLKKEVPVIFQPSNLSEARNSPIAILVETREEGKQGWRPLMSSTWRLRPTRIEVCIVYWNDQIGRPAIKGLTLFPYSEEKADE